MKIEYLGPEGSFSHEAAGRLNARLPSPAELIPLANVQAVVRSIAAVDTQPAIGLIPYYNFLEGVVQEHLDLVYESQLQIAGLMRLPIEFSAGSFETPPSASREVISHPKALAQVSEFIHTNFRHATVSPVSSTSEAARIVGETKMGVAISSEAALQRFHVPIFARGVGNLRHGKPNFTDFFIVRRNDADLPIDFGMPNHAIIAITPKVDRPGLLAELLGQLCFYGLDIAKIHSRPALEPVECAEEPQMFYLEVKCAPDAEGLLRCASALRYRFGNAAGPGELLRVMGGFRV